MSVAALISNDRVIDLMEELVALSAGLSVKNQGQEAYWREGAGRLVLETSTAKAA